MSVIRIKIPEIMADALSRVDRELTFHCERVACMMMLILDQDPRFDPKTKGRIIWTILLHDIGLFHRINDGARDDSEREDKYSHSEYGYLFLKEFIPHAFLAELVRYHHSSWQTIDDTPALSDEMKEVARILKTVDRIDLCRMGGALLREEDKFRPYFEEAKAHLTEKNYRVFKKTVFDTAGVSMEKVHRELMDRFAQYVPTEFEQNALLRTLVNAIDFRSHYTAIHCFVAEKVADAIGEASGLDQHDKQTLHVGIMLHDLGKIAIPLTVLEAPGSLNDHEWEIMKSHVVITRELLEQRVDDDVLQVAIRHHETLDGSGYPYGIKGECITKVQRIAAVADIISALTEERSYKKPFQPDEILDILRQMARNGKICMNIVRVAEENQKAIFDAASRARKDIIDIYTDMMAAYKNAKGYEV